MVNDKKDEVVKKIQAQYEHMLNAGIKKWLKTLIKDHKEKDQKTTPLQDLQDIRAFYESHLKMTFDRILDDALSQGVIVYSGYIEVKDDDDE